MLVYLIEDAKFRPAPLYLKIDMRADGRETWTHSAVDATPFERSVDAWRWLSMRATSEPGLTVTQHDFPDNDGKAE